nr:uncharacterized protein LOC127323559 [Lolium perenne]
MDLVGRLGRSGQVELGSACAAGGEAAGACWLRRRVVVAWAGAADAGSGPEQVEREPRAGRKPAAAGQLVAAGDSLVEACASGGGQGKQVEACRCGAAWWPGLDARWGELGLRGPAGSGARGGCCAWSGSGGGVRRTNAAEIGTEKRRFTEI